MKRIWNIVTILIINHIHTIIIITITKIIQIINSNILIINNNKYNNLKFLEDKVR